MTTTGGHRQRGILLSLLTLLTLISAIGFGPTDHASASTSVATETRVRAFGTPTPALVAADSAASSTIVGVSGVLLRQLVSATGVATEAGSVRGTNATGEVTSRSSFRKGTTQGAWDEAAPGPNGGRLCPTCGDEVHVEPGTGTRANPSDWDRSHNPSWTNREFPPDVTRSEVIDNYNDGVSLECGPCNRAGQNNDGRFGGG